VTRDLELLVKALASGGADLALSILAERLGPRVAGVFSSALAGAVLIYFLVGHEVGTGLVIASVTYALVGLAATQAFLHADYLGSAQAPRRPVMAAVVSGAGGVPGRRAAAQPGAVFAGHGTHADRDLGRAGRCVATREDHQPEDSTTTE